MTGERHAGLAVSSASGGLGGGSGGHKVDTASDILNSHKIYYGTILFMWIEVSWSL
jgi:hypothetical protein